MDFRINSFVPYCWYGLFMKSRNHPEGVCVSECLILSPYYLTCISVLCESLRSLFVVNYFINKTYKIYIATLAQCLAQMSLGKLLNPTLLPKPVHWCVRMCVWDWHLAQIQSVYLEPISLSIHVDPLQDNKNNLNETTYIYTEYLVHTVSAH